MASSSAAATAASSSSAAAAPSSRINQLKKYEVFISFRGEDMRSNFVSHLHRHLKESGVRTFLDSEEFEKAKRFDDLLAAIKDSNIAVVIFSKDYGSSPWCWDELAEIMKCETTHRLKVIPVFYNVEPNDVGLEGSFGKRMKALKLDKEQKGRLSDWEAALKAVPNRCGFHHGISSKNFRVDHALVRAITETVLQKIGHLYNNDSMCYVGMPFRIQKFEELLCISSEETRFIGIQGMGGIGKTTLANSVFDKYYSRFDGSCFLSNVREALQKRGRLEELKSKLLDEVFCRRKIGITKQAKKNQLHQMRVLIVLDDIDNYMQFEHLIGEHNNLRKGSKVIVTSRDMGLLRKITDPDFIFEVPGMIEGEARQLFDKFCLKGKLPSMHHGSLSERVLKYARGNPLALKVLGLLFHDLDEKYWEGAFESLHKTLNKDIDEVLKVSFDTVRPDQKEIFLHIACFLKGSSKSDIKLILDSCGFASIKYDLDVLDKKALITVSETRGTIEMHDLLQEMGRNIVLQEKEPGDRSRLWSHDDIRHVFTEDSGSGAVKAIFLNLSEISEWDLSISPFAKMNGIQLLKFYNVNSDRYADYPRGLESSSNALRLPEGRLESLPRELRYLHWSSYPLESLPSLPPKIVAAKEQVQQWNLVVIDMPSSKVVQLWREPQHLPNLKVIKLPRCRQMIEMPDFSNAPKLEIIDFRGCEKLQKVCPSISRLHNLEELILDKCVAIESVPSTTDLKSLKKLGLRNCRKLSEFPKVSPNIDGVELAGTVIKEVPPLIGSLSQLHLLFLDDCKGLEILPDEFAELQSLCNLSLGPCIKEECLHILGSLSSLCRLSLRHCNFSILPPIINWLSRLEVLDIDCCRELESLEQLPGKLSVMASGCSKLHEVSFSTFTPWEDWDAPIRLLFMNSPSLARDATTNILEHAKQIIKVMAPAVLKLPQIPHRREVTVVYPGNQIPKGFGNAINGSSVSIELPPGWPNDNFLGFILSVVLDHDKANTQPEFHDLTVIWKFEFEANGGESWKSDLSFNEWPVKSLDEKHVFMFYSTRFHHSICEHANNSPIGTWKEASFEAIIGDPYESETPCFTVEQCAVELLYVDDDDGGNRMHEDDDLSGALADNDHSVPLSLSADTIHHAGPDRMMNSMEGTQNMSGLTVARKRRRRSTLAVQGAETQFGPIPVAPIPAVSAPSAGTAPPPALSTVTLPPADFHYMGPSGDIIVGSIPSPPSLQAHISSDAVAVSADSVRICLSLVLGLKGEVFRRSYDNFLALDEVRRGQADSDEHRKQLEERCSQLEGLLRRSEGHLQLANARCAQLEVDVEELRRQLAGVQNFHADEEDEDEEGNDEEGDPTGPPDL